jgi:excisionase family DNA binding protein
VTTRPMHQDNYLTTAEVAELLHVVPKTVSRWAKEGRLPFLRTLGGHRRYPESRIRELADRMVNEPEVEP